MKEVKVTTFGEAGADDKWFEDPSGNRIDTSEDTINALWNQWIVHEFAERADKHGYIIFTIMSGNPLITIQA